MRWIGEYTTFVDPDKKITRKDYGDGIKVVPDEAFGGAPDMPDGENLKDFNFDEIANAFNNKDI